LSVFLIGIAKIKIVLNQRTKKLREANTKQIPIVYIYLISEVFKYNISRATVWENE
jgi:hypothetical protein